MKLIFNILACILAVAITPAMFRSWVEYPYLLNRSLICTVYFAVVIALYFIEYNPDEKK
jgi:hypothetical protein